MDSKDSNKNIKLRLKDEKAGVNADTELELDGLKIEDLNFEVKSNKKEENKDVSSNSSKNDEDSSSSKPDVAEEMPEDNSNNEMQDISDDNIENEPSDNKEDLEEIEDDSTEDNVEKPDKNRQYNDKNVKTSNENKPENDDTNKKTNRNQVDDDGKKNAGNNSVGNEGDNKPNENKHDAENWKPDGNNDKKNGGNEKKEGSRPKNNDNSSIRNSSPNSSRQNSNKNRPPKANKTENRSFRDRAQQGLKSRVQQGFNNSRLGQTINKEKNTVNTVKETVENTKKLVSLLAKHPWLIAVLVVILLMVFIVMIVLMLASTPDTSNETVCTSSEQSLGTYNSDIIKGQAVIVLKDSQSGTFSEIKAANSLYGTDDLSLSMKRYAMGVAYSEVGTNVKNEAIAKAEMIAAKSFVLGRTAPGSANTMGMSFEYDQVDDKTVFYLRGNTYDQDFCDVYEGCETGRYAKSNITAGNNEAKINQKGPLDSKSIENLSKWYDETMSEFVFDDKTKTFNGTQFSSYGYDLCKVGTCLSQTDAIKAAENGSTYDEILYKLSYSSFTKYNMETSNIIAVSTDCTDAKLSCGISNNDFKYYSQINEPYGSTTFCHRTDGGTIKQAGCGITSMAMVLANLTDQNVDPFTTNEEAFNGGYCGNGTGTSHMYFLEAAEKYNIKYTYGIKSDSTDISKASKDIINTIKKGGLVIINVNGSWLNGNSGHYIVVKGIDENNNLIIADPYATSLDKPVRNNVSAEKVLKDFVNNESGWFMFTSDKSNEIVNKYCKSTSEGSVADGKWVRSSNYDLSLLRTNYGKQKPFACYSASATYGARISTGYSYDNLFGRNPGPSASAFGATYAQLGSETEVFKKIIEEVNKGKAVALHGGRSNGSKCQEHWVTAVGYREGFTLDNASSMKLSDILTVDTADANEKPLSQSLPNGLCSGCGVCFEINYWK